MIPVLAEFTFNLNPFAFEDSKILISLILGVVLFVAFLVVAPPVFPLGVKALNANLAARQTRIADDQAQVQRALADVQQVRNDYASRLQRIEAEQRERIDAAVREAETARTEIIAEAQAGVVALRRRNEEEIARERTTARIAMRRQIVALTLDAAESSVRSTTDANVQHSLISDFITRMAQGTNGAHSGNGASSAPALPEPKTVAFGSTSSDTLTDMPVSGPTSISTGDETVEFGTNSFGTSKFGASQSQSQEGA